MAATAILEEFQMVLVHRYFAVSATGRPIHFMFGGVFWDGGSNGAIFDSNKFKIG